MAKPTDRKTIAIEKIACSSQLPRGRGMTCPMGPHGGSARAVRKQKERGGDVGNFIVVAARKMEEGRVSRFGIGSFQWILGYWAWPGLSGTWP